MFYPWWSRFNINSSETLMHHSGFNLVTMMTWAKKKKKKRKRIGTIKRRSSQSVTGLWTEQPRCQERSQKNNKICSSWQLAPNNITGQYRSDVKEGGGGVLNQASHILKGMDRGGKTPCQAPLCHSKQMKEDIIARQRVSKGMKGVFVEDFSIKCMKLKISASVEAPRATSGAAP